MNTFDSLLHVYVPDSCTVEVQPDEEKPGIMTMWNKVSFGRMHYRTAYSLPVAKGEPIRYDIIIPSSTFALYRFASGDVVEPTNRAALAQIVSSNSGCCSISCFFLTRNDRGILTPIRKVGVSVEVIRGSVCWRYTTRRLACVFPLATVSRICPLIFPQSEQADRLYTSTERSVVTRWQLFLLVLTGGRL